jgi:putative DNA primase/helicase
MNSFEEAISAAGYQPPKFIIMDGNLQRFSTDPNKNCSKDGWYVGFDNNVGKVVIFGSWRDGTRQIWTNGTGRQLTEQEKSDIERKRELAQVQVQKEYAEAAQRATQLYDSAVDEDLPHGYLRKKGIEKPSGAKLLNNVPKSIFGFLVDPDRRINALIMPVYGPSGTIASLQIIDEYGDKKFMKGGSTVGGWFSFGGDIVTAKYVVIGEGIATVQSIHQATGFPVVAAYSAANLPQVAAMVRAKNAMCEILIAVDGDKAGRDYAAKCHNCRLVEAPDGMDWNDVYQSEKQASVEDAFVTNEINMLWKAGLIIKTKSDGTQTIPCRAQNLILILSHHQDFFGRIKYNELSQQVCIDDNEVDEASIIKVKAQMERHVADKVGTNELIEAMSVVAFENKVHPIRDYLRALKWDGENRVSGLFFEYFGAQNSEYTIAVSKSFLVSSVARIMQPGCQVDTMVVLEGAQGGFKSSSLIALFSPEWHSEATARLGDKDFFQNLRGKWVMEFGEMTHITRSDSTQIKQMLTMRTDNYRPSYARFNKDVPRQNIFAGTINEDAYLNDPTGARRYLPVLCGKIDIDAIKRDRDQFWAEALLMFYAGEKWWDIPDAEREQEERYQPDSWEEIIAKWLVGKIVVSVADILIGACGLPVDRIGRSEETRIGKIMTRFKWPKRNDTVGGLRVRRYYRQK